MRNLLFAQQPTTFQVQDQPFHVAKKAFNSQSVVLPYDCDGLRAIRRSLEFRQIIKRRDLSEWEMSTLTFGFEGIDSGS